MIFFYAMLSLVDIELVSFSYAVNRLLIRSKVIKVVQDETEEMMKQNISNSKNGLK